MLDYEPCQGTILLIRFIAGYGQLIFCFNSLNFYNFKYKYEIYTILNRSHGGQGVPEDGFKWFHLKVLGLRIGFGNSQRGCS